MKKYLQTIIALSALLLTTACVYRIDIPQGNYVEQRKIDKLRVDMTPDQVVFVLGTPVINNMFKQDEWIYLYFMKRGATGEVIRKELRLKFNEDKLVEMTGDFEKPEEFDVPLGV